MTTPTSAPPQPDEKLPENTPKTPRKKRRRLLRWLLLILLALITALAGAVYWLAATESGLRFALLRLPAYFGTQVQAQTLRGTLLDGFQGSGWQIRTEAADVDISDFQFQWQPAALWRRHLHIQTLSAGDIHIQTKPVPPRPDQARPKLPENLQLPFSIGLDKLAVGNISFGKQKTVILRGFQAAYAYDHNAHRLNIVTLKTPWSQSSGEIKLAAQKPFALEGVTRSQGELDGIAIENLVDIGGDLSNIKIRTDLSGNGVGLHADTALSPFAATLNEQIGHIQIKGGGINPKAFLPNLPEAALTFDATVVPSFNKGVALDGSIDLLNDLPLPADKSGIPVRTLLGEFTVDESGKISSKNLTAQLIKQASVQLSGSLETVSGGKMNLNAQVKNLTAADLVSTALAGKVNGSLSATGTLQTPQFGWQLDTGSAGTSGILKILTDTKLGQRTLKIEKGLIRPHGGGEMQLSGSLELFKKQKLALDLNSSRFNPAKLYPDFPQGDINGKIKLGGELATQAFHADMQFAPSTLSGAALSGTGKVSYENKHLSRADTQIVLGSNRLQTQGSFGRKGDTLRVDINAPELHRFGFGLQGLLTAKGSITSTADGWTKVKADLAGQARNLNIPNAVSVGELDFKVSGAPEADAPLAVSLKGRQLSAGGVQIETADGELSGSLRRHTLNARAAVNIDRHPLNLNVAAIGGLDTQNQWRGQVNTLDINGALDLKLQNTLQLEAGAQRVVLSPARWQALGGSLNLERFVWDRQNGLSSKGSANNLDISQLHRFYTPPVEHNLVLAGDWDLAYSSQAHGYLNLRQQGGDIILPTRKPQPLGLNGMTLRTTLTPGGINSLIEGGTKFGNAQGNIRIDTRSGSLAQAPLSGNIRLDAEDLQNLKNIVPVGQTLKGKLTADIGLGGRLDNPQLSGSINGENLYYRNRDVGAVLENGKLVSHLQDRRWIIDSLRFQNGGTVTLSGSVELSGSPDVSADIVFDKYRLLDQPNRRLTVSGNAKLGYNPNNGLLLDGALSADEGKFGFQDGSMPSLSDDVVVLGEEKPQTTSATLLNINLLFDLNDKIQFAGQGLNITVGGKLRLSAKPQQAMQAVGSINVVKGRYKAYGQDLVISKGVISFVGPMSNPNLNIRAERRNSSVGAGVEVLGNLETPRVSLVANEPMSEKDKLSWLILNRASSGSSGDEAALATAAGALLAGNINDRIGLVDDFGLTSRQSRNAQTGEMNPAQQVLTFGKQLTQNLYLGYEAGLGNASQSVKLVYQLSKSIQAVFRGGTESSGGEIKYSHRFD